jgi:carbamoyl-phosphate synthase large subunit
MKKIFILGGSSLQMDLILEAKKMFFHTIVLDMNKDCIGAKWCDEFLQIDIANKELVLQKAQEYKIDMILTSATELGNTTACYVGEKLKLNTNSYQTALNTTNKVLMKEIFIKNNIPTAKHISITKDDKFIWDTFPCIVKPSDSSAGRGLSYCKEQKELKEAIEKASSYSKDGYVLIEQYIKGEQFSVESISCKGMHQIIAINKEYINTPPYIMEISHTLPAPITSELEKNIEQFAYKILNIFNILYGASHIELRVTEDMQIYPIEIASRTGGMRSEMINLAYGISYSQLLLLSAFGILSKIEPSRHNKIDCYFIVNYEAYKKYLKEKKEKNIIVFEPFAIDSVKSDFTAEHIGKSKGYYFVIRGDQ